MGADDAGVVHKDVDCAEIGNRLRRHLFYGLLAGDVEAERDCAWSKRPYFVGDTLRILGD